MVTFWNPKASNNFKKESIKKKKLSKYGDADLDGSPNLFDCDPREVSKDKSYGSIKKSGSYEKFTVKSGVVGRGGGMFSPSGELLSKVLPSVAKDKTPITPPVVTKFTVRSGVVGKDGGLFTTSGKQLSKPSRDIDEEATARARLQKEIEVRQAGGRGTRLPGGFSGVAPNVQKRSISQPQIGVDPQRAAAVEHMKLRLRQEQIASIKPATKLSNSQKAIRAALATQRRKRFRGDEPKKKYFDYF